MTSADNLVLFSSEDEYFMELALQQALLAQNKGEVPVGAVIVSHGEVIGQGYNCPISSLDPTAHAEIQAIRSACKAVQNYRLPKDAVLYVTLEPCTQCVGALIHARISKVVFAANEPRAGSLVSARKLLEQGFYNHYFDYVGGCLAESSRQLLQQFFRQKRDTTKK